METGRVGLKLRDIEGLLTLYGVADESSGRRSSPWPAGRGSRSGGHSTPTSCPTGFETYLGLESAAVAIRSFEAQFWPGLLQTGDYARAVTRLGHKSAPQGEVEQLTSAVYLDQRADVEHYLEVADQLSGEALTPADTISFIEQAACETRPERKSDDHRRDGTARKEHRAAAVRHQQGAPCPDL